MRQAHEPLGRSLTDPVEKMTAAGAGQQQPSSELRSSNGVGDESATSQIVLDVAPASEADFKPFEAKPQANGAVPASTAPTTEVRFQRGVKARGVAHQGPRPLRRRAGRPALHLCTVSLPRTRGMR